MCIVINSGIIFISAQPSIVQTYKINLNDSVFVLRSRYMLVYTCAAALPILYCTFYTSIKIEGRVSARTAVENVINPRRAKGE